MTSVYIYVVNFQTFISIRYYSILFYSALYVLDHFGITVHIYAIVDTLILVVAHF